MNQSELHTNQPQQQPPAPDDFSADFARSAESDKAAVLNEWAENVLSEGSPDKTRQPPAENPAPKTPERGMFSTVVRNVAEIPRGLAHGAVRGINEAYNLMYDLGEKLREAGPEIADYSLNLDFRGGGVLPNLSFDKGKPKGRFQIRNIFSKPQTITGDIASGVGQFLTGFLIGNKAQPGIQAATTAGKIGKAMASGAFSDFAFFDGHEKNLSNLIQEFPALQNPVNEFLAASPEDGELEGRFKRTLEGLGLGASVEGFILGVKALRAYRAAKKAASEAGPGAMRAAAEEARAGRAGLESLGEAEAPLVSPLRVDEIVPQEPMRTTLHEVGVSGLPNVKRNIRHSPDFTAAKTGDMDAAQRVVGELWTDTQTKELATRLDPNMETVFISVPSTSGKNALPDALGEKLAREMGGTYVDYRGIYKTEAAEAMKFIAKGDRPFSPRGYVLENPEALQALAGKQVVVVEDILSTGASARQFIDALRKEGIEVNSVAALMGNPRLDAPPQLVSKLQSALRNAGMDVKGGELAESLSNGEIEAIITRINRTGNANERAELAAKLRGILDGRSGKTVGQHLAAKGTRDAYGAERAGAGDAPSIGEIPSGPGGLEPGRGTAESGHGAGQEAAQALRDRSGPLGGRGGEQAAGGQAGSFRINFSRIDAPEDVKTVMQNMADGYRGELEAARRGVRAFEQTALSAEQENAWKILAERRTGQPLNAEQSLAARNLWASSGQKLSELAELATNAPTEENLFAFRKMLEVHRAVQNEVIAARTETARALGSWRIPSGSRDMQLRQMADVLNGTGGIENARELAARVARLSQAGMARELDALVSKSAYALTRDSIQEAWVMALLSGPKTHIVNTMGNTTVALGQVFERWVAGRIGRVLGEETGVMMGESLAMLNGMMGGVKDGLRLAAKAFWMNQKTGWGGKIDLPHTPAISSENWRLAKDGVLGKTVDVLGNAIRLPGRALMAEDEFFKAVGYRAELHAQAYREATREAAAGKIGRDQIKGRMAEILENPPESLRMAAVDHATYATFQNAPGDFTKWWMRGTRNVPALRFFTPFVKTPANIFNYSIAERSPFAPLFRSFREDIAAGGAREQIALARVSTGTTVMLAAADIAYSGLITGGGPANPAEKQALMRTGWQPYSIKIGDRYFSYSRLDPVGVTLGIAADIADITTHMDHDDREVDPGEAAAYFAASIAGNVMSKNYMQGIAGIIDVLANPQDTNKVKAFVQRFAGSFSPAALAEVARHQDPYRLELNSILDGMRARVPGLSKDLPLRRDLWGRPISFKSGLGAVYDAVSPIASRRENPEPIDLEMLKQEAFVAAPKRQVVFDGVTVDLTRDEFKGAYSRYAQLAGNALKHPAWGKGCMDYLNDVVTGKSEMSQKYEMLSDGPDGGKAQFIRSEIAEYRELARKRLIEEYPGLAAYILEKKAAMPGKYTF